MLFNSYVFILMFLPATLLVFWRLRAGGRHRAGLVWLVAASLFFYGWWNPDYLALLLFSMLGNYLLAGWLVAGGPRRRLVLTAAIVFNLGLLGWFKYAGFLAGTVNALTPADLPVPSIVLPLAISFFTFQQIAYQVDAYQGRVRDHDLVHYILFVTFFPQLIAGPIVHPAEMMPQFARPSHGRRRQEDLAVGLTVFFIGLFKKVVMADGISVHATPVFAAAQAGADISFLEAWVGALAYTFQLYFDFSGYSDMAVGAARLFGIRLPVNFDSPYKAASIIDFWGRWHITLSRFLRDYLYIPLGGNRRGALRRYANLLITMVLGGLWHGANWTFVAWGALHGLYLVVNHGWRALRLRLGWLPRPSPFGRAAGVAVTFVLVVVAWVPFRAESFGAAAEILAGMAGLNGVLLPDNYEAKLGALAPVLGQVGVGFDEVPLYAGVDVLLHLAALAGIAFLLPNTQQWLRPWRPVVGWVARRPALPWPTWRPGLAWGLLIVGFAAVSFSRMTGISEFLYFQF